MAGVDGIGSEPQPPGAGEGPRLAAAGPRRSRLHEAVGAATERIQEIIDAAERAAEEIRRDAEAEAERYLAERRREADRLTARQAERLAAAAANVREQFARIGAEGAAIVAELEKLSGSPGQDPGATPEAAAAEPEAGDGERPADPAPAAGPSQQGDAGRAGADPPAGGLREAALIRATQMVVGGSSRSEVDAALRAELGLANPGPLLDELFADDA